MSQSTLKHSPSTLTRDDSISSKNSFTSLFPSIIKSLDSSSGFSISQSFIPRPEKTLVLFDILLNTLKTMYQKYSKSYGGDSVEVTNGIDNSTKVDTRIALIETLKFEYECLIKEKKMEMDEIEKAIKIAISNKNAKEEIDMLDCENYWKVCRDMCITESKLERCAGKLQFQIMGLESVSRIHTFDQYELSIRLNNVSKFKTRIRVEKNERQIWENMNFVIMPTIDDTFDVKFCELKTLNKSVVLTEKKMILVNNLILAEPSFYTFWLTPIGTIKLNVIVQWNPMLDDSELNANLHQIDNKYPDINVKEGVLMRKRSNSTTKTSHHRLSANFGSLFRSDIFDRSSRGSMENIAEQVDDEKLPNVSIRNTTMDRQAGDRIKAVYHDDMVTTERSFEEISAAPVTININDSPLIVCPPDQYVAVRVNTHVQTDRAIHVIACDGDDNVITSSEEISVSEDLINDANGEELHKEVETSPCIVDVESKSVELSTDNESNQELYNIKENKDKEICDSGKTEESIFEQRIEELNNDSTVTLHVDDETDINICEDKTCKDIDVGDVKTCTDIDVEDKKTCSGINVEDEKTCTDINVEEVKTCTDIDVEDEKTCTGINVGDEKTCTDIDVEDKKTCTDIDVEDEKTFSGINVEDEKTCTDINVEEVKTCTDIDVEEVKTCTDIDVEDEKTCTGINVEDAKTSTDTNVDVLASADKIDVSVLEVHSCNDPISSFSDVHCSNNSDHTAEPSLSFNTTSASSTNVEDLGSTDTEKQNDHP